MRPVEVRTLTSLELQRLKQGFLAGLKVCRPLIAMDDVSPEAEWETYLDERFLKWSDRHHETK